MRIGFGVPVSGSWATPDNMITIARRAEELGYHSLWAFQRLLFPAGHAMGPVYRSVQDPIVTLSYLAGATSTIRLGVAVLNLPFFSPPLLAKQLATLQIVSRGRLDAGLGLGWLPEEFAASGVPIEHRGRRAEEYVEVLRALWSHGIAEHRGEFYHLPPVHSDPKPDPLPSIILGGTAEPALRRAGRLADGWVSSSRADLAAIGQQIYIVKEAAREAGRDPEALRIIVRGVTRPGKPGAPDRRPLSGSYEEIRRDLAVLEEQGVTEVFHDLNFNPEVGSPDADATEAMRLAEEALESLSPRY
jgi:probable F420-dependent oxidoreductase